MNKTLTLLLTLLMTAPVAAKQSHSMMHHATKHKPAIVLATFGTTYDSALNSLLNIKKDVEKAYPNVPVRFAFTSNIIRKKWNKRQHDKTYQKNHPDVPKSLYHVKNILGALADLQNEGYKDIVVQTTLLTHGEEFTNLKQYIKVLNSIEPIKKQWKPFNKIALGRPLMGTWGLEFPYQLDVAKLAHALKHDVAEAKAANAALVYMGHGNKHLSTGLYFELQKQLNKDYPNQKIYVGTVEGHPDFASVKAQIKHDGIQKVLLRPLMVVAGDHANNDMAGNEPDSWKSQLEQIGVTVKPVLSGLGNNPDVRALYLQHLADAASHAKIKIN